MPELSPNAINKPNDFKAKLSFAERCAVLALHRKGASTRVVASAFKINRRTVTHIIQGWRGYSKCADEEKSRGTEAFLHKYLTEDVINRVNATADDPEVNQSYKEYDRSASNRTVTPSRRASGTAGINYYKPSGSDIAHRIDVAWLEANTASDASGPFEHPAGWYWRDLDGTDQFWNGNPEEGSHLTSMKALNHAKQELA